MGLVEAELCPRIVESASEWFVLFTRPKYEKKVRNALDRKNIESFLPLVRVVRTWSDRTKKLDLPLFPNYIFVNLSEKRMWEALEINGVVRFLKTGPSFSKLSQQDISNIRIAVMGNPLITVRRYPLGRQYEIIEGPLMGMHGKLVSLKGRSKLCLYIEALRQSILVDVSTDNVRESTKPIANHLEPISKPLS